MTADAAFWDRIAEKYAKSPIRNPEAYEFTLGRTRSYLNADDRVLELGCGTGSTALALAPGVAQITGTDLSEGMIAIARDKAAEQGHANADFTVASALEGGEGTYDAVLGFNLFHLVPQIEESFAHVRDLLKPGGLFISKTVCLAQPGQGIMRFVFPPLIWGMQAIGKAPFVHRLTIAQLEGMITRAGFEIIEMGNHPARPPSRYIVARRL